MRKKFQNVFPEILPDFKYFEPEFAMNDYFTLGDNQPFDISEFEEIIGQLSHSIVLFPEAPGSYAELGHFSTVPALAEKIVLAMDTAYQEEDSFISLGPAKKIQARSIFQANIQMDYKNPDFTTISNRLVNRKPLNKTLEAFAIAKFSEMSAFQVFALIREIVSLLKIATTKDIEFILRSIFAGHIEPSTVKKIISILVGSGYLSPVGDFGHLAPSDGNPAFLFIREGAKTAHKVLRIDIAAILTTAEEDFRAILEAY